MRNKICVITPTVRLEGLPLVQRALEEQEFVDFDWFVCSPTEPKKSWATWIPDDFKGGVWSLNRAYNALISKADCELIVSWQDHTYAKGNTLQKFWNKYQYEPTMLVSAKGDKYENERFNVKTWTDPRTAGFGDFRQVEWNLCSCPRKALIDVGGFDEEMDFKFYGMDGYNVNQRLADLGYTFYVDRGIESFSVGHGRVKDWDERNGIHGLYTDHAVSRRLANKWPILNYLEKTTK